MNAEHQQLLMLGTSEGSDRMNETEQTLASVGYASTRASIGSGRSDIVDTPQDWSVKTISEVAVVRTGPFGSALHERDYVDDGTPIITVEHLSERGIVHEGLPLVSDADRSRLAEYELRAGDIVFSRVGSIDRNSLISKEESGWLFSGRLLRVRTLDDAIYPPYLSYHFHSEPFKRRVRTVAVGQTMASLNTNILNAVCVVLPSTPEQHAIAEALSDVDGLLGALEALIAKKREIKQAAMQQLLTGKTRLPGFSGEWKTMRLGELSTLAKGRGVKREDVSNEGLPCVLYGELYTRYHNYILEVSSRIPQNVAQIALPIEAGDLLFAGSGETAEDIGRCAAYLGNESAYAGGDIIVLRSSGQDPTYLGHLFNHPTVKAQKARMGQGNAVVHISTHNLAQVQISLPPAKEQSTIAAVLLDMDSEIATLERRRAKTRAIKQGMMQVLLTGRVRLVEPDAHAEDPSC